MTPPPDLPAFHSLLEPLDPACPCGPDLAYGELAAIERDATPGLDAPDWASIEARTLAALERSRDLRLAVWLARAALARRGLPGLADGLVLAASLLQRHWHDLHPRPDPDDSGATERANVLANLSPDPAQSHPTPAAEAFLADLRGTTLLQSPTGARLTVRDLDALATTEPAISDRWRDSTDPQRAERAEAARRGLVALDAIESAFARNTGQGLRLQPLRRVFLRIERLLAQPAPDAPVDDPDEVVAACADNLRQPPNSGAPASRGDAVKALQHIAAWVRSAEPSSPAPMFIDRAAALLQMDFSEIVRTLLPSARSHVELLGGVPLDAGPH